ncbi:MAG: hypothetical protein ACYDBH_15600 [Acidobacteriaceae bacterium]
MLLNYFAGNTRLWLGKPFLVRTWLEPTASDFSRSLQADPGNLIPSSTFRLVEPEGHKTEIGPVTSTIEGLPVPILGIDTSTLPPGVYEVSLTRGNQIVYIPELIWLLPKDHYVAVVRDEFSEEDMGGPMVTKKEDLVRYLDHVEKIRWPQADLAFKLLYDAKTPFSFGRIEGMISTVLDVFRYLAVFGLKAGANATLSIGDETFEFGVEARLEYPPPREVERALHDRDCSDLMLMQSMKSDGEKLDFDISIEYGHARVRIQHSMPQLVCA